MSIINKKSFAIAKALFRSQTSFFKNKRKIIWFILAAIFFSIILITYLIVDEQVVDAFREKAKDVDTTYLVVIYIFLISLAGFLYTLCRPKRNISNILENEFVKSSPISKKEILIGKHLYTSFEFLLNNLILIPGYILIYLAFGLMNLFVSWLVVNIYLLSFTFFSMRINDLIKLKSKGLSQKQLQIFYIVFLFLIISLPQYQGIILGILKDYLFIKILFGLLPTTWVANTFLIAMTGSTSYTVIVPFYISILLFSAFVIGVFYFGYNISIKIEESLTSKKYEKKITTINKESRIYFFLKKIIPKKYANSVSVTLKIIMRNFQNFIAFILAFVISIVLAINMIFFETPGGDIVTFFGGYIVASLFLFTFILILFSEFFEKKHLLIFKDKPNGIRTYAISFFLLISISYFFMLLPGFCILFFRYLLDISLIDFFGIIFMYFILNSIFVTFFCSTMLIAPVYASSGVIKRLFNILLFLLFLIIFIISANVIIFIPLFFVILMLFCGYKRLSNMDF